MQFFFVYNVRIAYRHNRRIYHTKDEKNLLLIPLLIIGGASLLYLTIDDINNHYTDANIGLGLAFMFTWIYSVITFVIVIIIIAKKEKK